MNLRYETNAIMPSGINDVKILQITPNASDSMTRDFPLRGLWFKNVHLVKVPQWKNLVNVWITGEPQSF